VGLAVLLGLFGCVGPGAAKPHFPIPAEAGKLAIEPGALAAAKALAAQIDVELAANRCDEAVSHFVTRAAEIRDWCLSLNGNLAQPATFRYDPLYPLSSGFVGRVTLRSDRMKDGRSAAFRIPVAAYIGPNRTGQMQVFPDRPWPGPEPVLTGVRAKVWLSPASEWIVVDATLDVETSGARVLPFELWSRAPGDSSRLRVAEVRQQGKSCRFQAVDDSLVVELARPADQIQLTVRYEGEPSHGSDWVVHDNVILRAKDARWLPLLAVTSADFDVTVIRPKGFFLFGQGDEDPASEASTGWETSRWRFHGSGFSLYGGPRYVVRRLVAGGLQVVLAVHPEDSKTLDLLVPLVQNALGDLRPLGAYPFKTLRVVETLFPGGYGALSNITFGPDSIDPARLEESRDFLTHEIAHGWFGGLVPPSNEIRRAGGWQETLATYVETWGASEASARAKRREWSDRYAAVPPEKDQAILSAGWKDGWTIQSAVTYSKGALVLSALEARVGRPTMEKALTNFLRKRAGNPSTWDDVVAGIAEVAGADTGAWLHNQLERAGAPDLKLADVVMQGDRVEARLVQTAQPSFEGRVEIGIIGPTGSLKTEVVLFKSPSTSLELTVPAGAQTLVLDPEYRLPRRYDPKAAPDRDGLAFDLGSSKQR
jgi:hypothetical protein